MAPPASSHGFGSETGSSALPTPSLYQCGLSASSSDPRRGSSLDEFLEEEGILEEATAKAAKKALAWQFAQAMKEQNVTKAALARRMMTSRAQLDRLLDPENQSVTLKTLARAAEILGMRVQIKLLDS
jgi:DNA-binding Xre family transcriptional regulator